MEKEVTVKINSNARVVEKAKGFTIIETVAIDRRGNEYTTQHFLRSTKALKKNEFVHVEGTLELENGINYINPIKLEKLASEPDDLKMNAWVQGEAAYNFLEPKSLNTLAGESKAPFGVVSIRTKSGFQRGIIFNNLIATFRQFVKAGAIVLLAGRIQYRTFTNKEGVEQTVAEIIADNNYTQVVKASQKRNPFSFSEEPQAQTVNGIQVDTSEPVEGF